MGKGKRLNSDQFVEEAIDNVRSDRAIASTLLVELIKILKQDETKHQYSGPVAAKYLETLQRSNEQMVKLAAILQRQKTSSVGLSSDDKEQLFDLLNEGQEDV